MKNTTRIAVITAVVAMAALALIAKQGKSSNSSETKRPAASIVLDPTVASAKSGEAAAVPATSRQLPKLLDLGAGKCIPCKMMAPILEGLKKGYEGKMDVEFIDVWQNPDAGKGYGVEMIPT